MGRGGGRAVEVGGGREGSMEGGLGRGGSLRLVGDFYNEDISSIFHHLLFAITHHIYPCHFRLTPHNRTEELFQSLPPPPPLEGSHCRPVKSQLEYLEGGSLGGWVHGVCNGNSSSVFHHLLFAVTHHIYPSHFHLTRPFFLWKKKALSAGVVKMRLPACKPNTSIRPVANCKAQNKDGILAPGGIKLLVTFNHSLLPSPITWLTVTIRDKSPPTVRSRNSGGDRQGSDELPSFMQRQDLSRIPGFGSVYLLPPSHHISNRVMVDEWLKRRGRPSDRWSCGKEINNASGGVWEEEGEKKGEGKLQ